MATVKKAAQDYGVIEGVLVYACLAQPKQKYQSEDTEYTISVLVDEDTADNWDEKFKKQPAKKVKISDFEEKFKIDTPEKFKGMKNVYEIKLKKDAVVNGEEKFPEYRPKVLLDQNDGERVEITESRLISNGSVGKVSYRINSNDYGTFAKLQNVLVKEDDFVEYVSTKREPGSEFGDSKPVVKEPAKESVTKARPEKPKAAPKVAKALVEEDEDDDSCPF